jgi:hypothetical protein
MTPTTISFNAAGLRGEPSGLRALIRDMWGDDQ